MILFKQKNFAWKLFSYWLLQKNQVLENIVVITKFHEKDLAKANFLSYSERFFLLKLLYL